MSSRHAPEKPEVLTFEAAAEAGADLLFETRRRIQDEDIADVAIDRVMRALKEERLRLRRQDPDDQ